MKKLNPHKQLSRILLGCFIGLSLAPPQSLGANTECESLFMDLKIVRTLEANQEFQYFSEAEEILAALLAHEAPSAARLLNQATFYHETNSDKLFLLFDEPLTVTPWPMVSRVVESVFAEKNLSSEEPFPIIYGFHPIGKKTAQWMNNPEGNVHTLTVDRLRFEDLSLLFVPAVRVKQITGFLKGHPTLRVLALEDLAREMNRVKEVLEDSPTLLRLRKWQGLTTPIETWEDIRAPFQNYSEFSAEHPERNHILRKLLGLKPGRLQKLAY